MVHSWALDASLDDDAAGRIAGYLDRLSAARARVNLIGDPPERWVARHVDDALVLAQAIPDGPLVDVGSGAGLPGLVLAALDPSRRITLVESLGRKAGFLEETATALALDAVAVERRRAEILGRDPEHREAYAVAVARALAAPAAAAELLLPLVETGGAAWLMLSTGDAEAFPADVATELGATVGEVRRYGLRCDEGEPRALLRLDKTGPTPERYPRRDGVPARKPLGASR